MRAVASVAVSFACACSIVWLACSSGSGTGETKGHDAGVLASDAAADVAVDAGPFALGVSCNDVAASIYGDPGALPADKGDILKCSQAPDMTAADLLAALTSNPVVDPGNQPLTYAGKPFTSGAHVYRILYRTERGDPAGTPGYSSALVLVPTVPRAAGPLPILVGAHETWGQAPQCAVPNGLTGPGLEADYDGQAYPLVGLGFPIIMPDLAGYANFEADANPPSAYAQYADEGKSTLDGARAMAKLFPQSFDGRVVLVGHSQGGHTALSALAISTAYAPELSVVASAVYAPLWISQRSWGAIPYAAVDYPLVTQPTANAVAVWYHYTHGELLDGPGHGLDPFLASKRSVITHFISGDCTDQGYDGGIGSAYPDLVDAATNAAGLFDPAFVTSVGMAATLGSPCATGDDVCAKWLQRYVEDRPHLTTSVPVLVEYGLLDQTLPPRLMACATDRLTSDQVHYSFCTSPDVGHQTVIRQQASYVADWIASQTLGEPAPAPCPTSNTIADDAGLVSCPSEPPND
jgi:pimeloyl-ACP methyl ester carboxylesterase